MGERVVHVRPLRFPLLDPLRALAAIGVLLVHTSIIAAIGGDADLLSGAWYSKLLLHLDFGVPVFFLLSAFLLYRPFVEARVTGTERTRFTGYGRRRFMRIVPAYWAVLTITAIVPGMAGAFTRNWWVYYGLLQNYPVYHALGTCAVDPFRCGSPVAWTLTVEVFFYLTLPLFVIAMAWLAKRARTQWLWFELSVVVLLSAISIVIQSSVPTTDLQIWLFFSPLGRAWWFGLGLALAAVSVHVAHRPREPAFVGWLRRHPSPPVVAGVALYVLTATTIPTVMAFPPVSDIGNCVAAYVLSGVNAALFMLPAIFGGDGGGLVRRALRHRALIWLGLVSYGIYLWHYPVLIFLLDRGVRGFVPSTVLTLALTVACAAASCYLLERPLMRRTRRPRVAPA